jgi:hypothetical protein
MSILAMLLFAQTAATIDGSQLKPGAVCYAIARGDTVIGATFQKVSAVVLDGQPVWDVVVHQRKVRYQVGKADHAELGYYGGGFAQRLGGDCIGIPPQ